MAKERADWLEYTLVREKSADTKLVKEINSLEEALQEAQEKIDH